MERVNCDLCGSNDPHPLFDRIDRFTDNDFKFVKCAQCGLIYLNPRPTQSEIVEYYPDNYESYKLLDYDNSSIQNWHIQRMLQTLLDFVEKFVNVRGHLLDIGCATGRFLITARDRGWEVKGVELVEKAAQIARQEYLLDVTIGSFESVSLPENYYGVITLWDVLEHLPSPRTTLEKAHRFLKDNGVLVFSIPNLKSFDRYLFGAAWIGWDAPRHFTLYSESELNQLFKDIGYILIEKKCITGGKGTFFLSMDLLSDQNKAFSMFRIFDPVISVILWPFRQVSYKLGRGPIITYVIRKNNKL